MLKKGWFVPHSMEETLHNIITAVDLPYLKTVPPAEFERLLLREISFLAPDAESRQTMEQYIRRNIAHLYWFVQRQTEHYPA